MSRIPPIATTRVTTSMMRGRLTSQIQSDQLDLFRLQNQLSTGYRIFLPSDDAASAQRAMALQRTIERKEQSLTNVAGAQAALNTTWSTLQGVSDNINLLRSEAQGVVDTIASEDDRATVVDTIDRLLQDFVRIGNTTFTGTYVFGGSETSSPPFGTVQQYVEYTGNEAQPQQFVDIQQLFDVGAIGSEVYGGFSEPVGDGADLNPQLSPNTRLELLNGGLGLSPSGSIEVTFTPTSPSEPATSAVIDLSNAATVDDIARLIEAGAPEGADLTVTIETNSLRIDTVGGGVNVAEVGQGAAARELGLLYDGPPTATLGGSDLNPRLRSSDQLDDLVGAKARGRVSLPGVNNDLVLTATTNGAAFNGVTLELIGGGTAGAESAVYNSGANTLTITIADGDSTAAQVATAITAEGTFSATTDYRDQGSPTEQGTGALNAGVYPATTLGGVDGGLDLASGLLVTNGDQAYTIDVSDAETVEDLLNELNRSEYGLVAEINAAGDGIDVRSRRSGADFTIGENGGTTAADLGLRTYTRASRLDAFNRGVGVFVEGDNPTDTALQNEFTIVAVEDGDIETYTIDVTGVATVDDLIAQIATDTGGEVAADLATVGNGLVLSATDLDTPATTASRDFSLGTDILTIEATTAGSAGNRPFTVEVTNSGGPGAVTTDVVGDTITIELNGNTADTDAIAASIEAELTGFTVTSNGPIDTISAAVGPIDAATLGGAEPSADAELATGSFTLPNGDVIELAAYAAGFAGNTSFTIRLVNDGADGLQTTVGASDPSIVTVNLGGSDSDTAAIAASLSSAIDGYAVSTGASPPAAVLQTDAGTLAAPVEFGATLTGGHDADSLTVSGSYAERLGFIPAGQESVTVVDGTVASTDRNVTEAPSVFTTLLRMREALVAGDTEALGREIERLDDDLDRVNFARAEIGVRLRNLESIEFRLEDEEVELRAALSDEIDADLVEVISDYTARQASYQASLQTAGTLLNQSLLDYI